MVIFRRQLPDLPKTSRLVFVFTEQVVFDFAVGESTAAVTLLRSMASAVLTPLSIDRTDVKNAVLTPTTKSKAHCAINTRTKRLTFAKPGVCRVKLVVTRNDTTTTAFFNLAVR